jgi:uroporphyrinogen-III synthase
VGPQTSAVARANGFVVAQEAKTASADGIADAVSRWNQERVATWVEAQLTPA